MKDSVSDPIHQDAVAIVRQVIAEGLGFNCTFVDDDMVLIVGLAQRAILAGLASDCNPNTLRTLMKAAERFRVVHEKALGRKIENTSNKEST